MYAKYHKRRQISCQIFSCICGIIRRSHALHGTEGFYEISEVGADAIAINARTFSCCGEDGIYSDPSMTNFLRQDLNQEFRRDFELSREDFCNSSVIASNVNSHSKITKGFLSYHNNQCQYNGDPHIHHDDVPRIEGMHAQPHPCPWVLGQGNDTQHLTYQRHEHKLNMCKTHDLQSL